MKGKKKSQKGTNRMGENEAIRSLRSLEELKREHCIASHRVENHTVK